MKKIKLLKSFALTLIPTLAFSSFVSCFQTEGQTPANNFLDIKNTENSIFIPQYQLGTFLENNFQQFVNVNYVSNEELDQSQVLISNFRQNLLPHKYLEIFIDNNELNKAVENFNKNQPKNFKLNIKNFSYEILYSQVKENDRDTSVLDVPLNIRYFDASENNPWKREQDFVVTKQVPGFKKNEEKQTLIDKVLQLDSQINPENAAKFDVKNKSKYSTLELVKILNSKLQIKYTESLVPEKETDQKFIEKTKYLNRKIDDIAFVGTDNEKDLIFNLPTIEDGVNYYLKDAKISDTDFSKIEITLRGVAAKNDKVYSSLDLHFTIGSTENNKFKDLTEEEFFELTKEKIDIKLKNHISAINYPWDKTSIYDFEIKNTNPRYEEEIVSVLSTSQKNRSAKLAIQLTDKKNPSNQPIYIEKEVGLPKHLELFDRENTDIAQKLDKPERAHLTIPELPRENLLQITNSVNQLANSFATPGGYQEFRTFYTSPQFTAALHIGEDVLVDAGMILKTFAKSKVISAYYLENSAPGTGIGAQVTLEVKVKDLDIDQKIKDNQLRNVDSLIFFFIHLDPSFLSQLGTVTTETIGTRKFQIVKDITPKTPLYLEKDQPFGKIGTTEVNGGWTPHVHMEVYPVYYEVNDSKKQEAKTFLNWDYIPTNFSTLRIADKRFSTYDKNPTTIKVTGVKISQAKEVPLKFNKDGTAIRQPKTKQKNNNQTPEASKNREYPRLIFDEFNKEQSLNPNYIFQFRTDDQSTVRLESLYSEAEDNTNK